MCRYHLYVPVLPECPLDLLVMIDYIQEELHSNLEKDSFSSINQSINQSIDCSALSTFQQSVKIWNVQIAPKGGK